MSRYLLWPVYRFYESFKINITKEGEQQKLEQFYLKVVNWECSSQASEVIYCQ